MKRLFDIIFSLIGLLLLLPIFAVVAVLIKIESSGPVFFTQKRIGRNLKPFNLYKFRTMVGDAPKIGLPITTGDAPRITRVGRFLRKTKLDELPQLCSILKGDMSFVGPRPALFNQHDLIDLRTMKGVHKLIPGLTGWAQINGRDDIPIPVKVEFDEYYMKRRSFFFDIKILWLTIFKVAGSAGIKH